MIYQRDLIKIKIHLAASCFTLARDKEQMKLKKCLFDNFFTAL
jgi:hypothetical protein